MAIRMSTQPKFPMVEDRVADMTAPRLSGASRPHATKTATTIPDPANTARSSLLLRVFFMAASRRQCSETVV